MLGVIAPETNEKKCHYDSSDSHFDIFDTRKYSILTFWSLLHGNCN